MNQVQSFKQRRANSPVALRHELIIIRHCLKIARSEWGLHLKETPFEQISLPKPPKSRKRRLSKEEYQKLYKASKTMKINYIWPIVLCAIETGMRRGEILKLKWSNINFDDRTAYLEDTKNGEDRYVPLSIKVIELLSSIKQSNNLVFLKLEKTAKYILQALALYLKLDEFYFNKFIDGGNSILRAIHYPPITKAPKKAERAAAHGDINLITLLMGAQGGGLQVLNRKNQWIDAIAKPNELMINIGDMLSRLTNNLLPSTIHRVVNPPKETWGNSRYSLPFFMHPIPEMPLNCIPNTVNENNPKKFEDILAGDFLHQRLIELGLIKK